ncbi:MAG: 2-oxoacid:acceptor oxidoreductase subunit alpha [Saccharofermentanales bacterium]
MDYNILIGGAAGQGMETFASVFSKLLQRNGYHLFTLQDYMSRVRGGHNYFQIRFSDKKVKTHRDELDVIIALNQETLDLHISRLRSSGTVLADDNVSSDDKRLNTIPAQAIAKELGNVRIFSSVMLGALLKLFSLGNGHLEDIYRKKFDAELTDLNMKAFDRGQTLAAKMFKTVKDRSGPTMLMHTNEAISLGALAAGLKFYSAYPMTPSTSIMSYLTRQSGKAQIIAEQAEDEIAAVNMAIGASFAGARAMTSTSGGGFSLMVEAMGLAGIAEVPLVIAVIQRPGPATGLPTRTEQSDLKFVINSSQGEFPRMVIALRNPEDAFYQTVRAFNLADKYQMTVILLGDQYLSDAVQTVEPFDLDKVTVDRYLADGKAYLKGKKYRRYELTPSGISPRLIPGTVPGVAVKSDSDEHDEDGNITEDAQVRISMVDKRARKFELLKTELIEPERIGPKDAEVLLVGWGSTHSQLSEAVALLNDYKEKRYAALVFGDVWPLPQKLITEMGRKAKTLINVEQNSTGQLKDIIREVTGITVHHSVLRYDGRPLSAAEICTSVRGVK